MQKPPKIMSQVCLCASEHFTDTTKTCRCEGRCLLRGTFLYVGMAQIAKGLGEDNAISDDSREPTTRLKAAGNLPNNQELGKFSGPAFMRGVLLVHFRSVIGSKWCWVFLGSYLSGIDRSIYVLFLG